jgi:hypothetical protein
VVAGIIILLAGLVSAQDPAPAPDGLPEKSSKQRLKAAQDAGVDDAFYVIEMRVIEGQGIGQETEPGRLRRPGNSYSATSERPIPAPDALAVLPPRYQPNLLERIEPAEPAEKSLNEELWDAVPTPGVALLAAPKVTIVAGQPATVMIQTQQIFSYLVPLGDGKFEVKRTALQELGMKFTLEVQPVDGDATSIDWHPLRLSSRPWTDERRSKGWIWMWANRSSPCDRSRPRPD